MRSISLLTVLLLVGEVAMAQPAVIAVAGPATDGELLELTGSGFGTKDPAAPLLWDDCTSAPTLDTHYDAWLPTSAQQGAEYNMAYRTLPFRGLDGPHDRLSYVLGGAHAMDNNSGTYAAGGNVGVGKNTTSHEYFVSYYHRVDPLYDEENNPTMGENMKAIVLSGAAGEFYVNDFPPGHGYVGYCGSDSPDVNFTGPTKFGRLPIDPANQTLPYGCSGNNLVEHQSPINGWVHMQWEGTYNQTFDSPQIALTTYPDNRKTHISHYGDPITVMEYARGNYPGYPKLDDLRFIGIGGFARVPRENNGVNSFRYFAAIYLDSTHARVMLADNADYEQATIVEPQPPTAWSDAAITVRANLGRLPDCSTAYLFVFDDGNTRNIVGFPVGTGGCTAPECSDALDNDGDGASDFPADGGCSDASDDDESDCGDGVCEGGESNDDCPDDCATGECPGGDCDTPAGGEVSGGCGCAVGGRGSSWLLLLVLLVSLARRAVRIAAHRVTR